MRRPARQREAIVAVGLLLSVLGSFAAGAAETKLISRCGAPEQGAGAAPPTLTCDLRASGFAAFEGVKAKLKGGSADLESRFEAFDVATKGATTAYLIQVMPNARRATLTQMGDAVVTFADARGKRRFTAYTFANDLTLISDSGASKNEFARQIIAIKPASATVQLYKSALAAVEALTRESGDRKALVILGDGTADDTSYGHDQVVKAAKDAGVTIHVLGYYDDRGERPNFQKLSRLAEDTGGFAAEVKQGPGKDRDFSADVVNSRFVGEVLENGGTLEVGLKGPAGDQTVVLSAELADDKTLAAEEKVTIPAAPAPSFEPPLPRTGEPPPPERSDVMDWLADNSWLVVVLGALLGGGIIAFVTYYGRATPASEEPAAGPELEPDEVTGPADSGEEGELLRDADGRPVVYGWLEMLDGGGTRHPLRTTNVRVGRHRDNDICLQNDSISRRHAVLHYNAESRRFVITDLGGGNGVVVNKTKYKSRELNDGDTVELGEVRLRFRAEQEFLV
ncbi:MAG: FHA domain-containing protein [Hyphomicrobium sp.]|uniref:FHA domain-containing protein n=1 Tax=Hyphomicrobium sp. TaxID=82 RepID=UPI003D11075F